VKLKNLTKDNVETGMQINAVVPENITSMIYVPIQSSEQFAISVNNKKIWNDGNSLVPTTKFYMI
jgi:hypothetical protein